MVVKSSPIAVSCDEWLLFDPVWMKFYHSDSNYIPEAGIWEGEQLL